MIYIQITHKKKLLTIGEIIIIGNVSLFLAGYCDRYTNITEPWRNREFTSTGFPGYPKDDKGLVNKWWRFTGIGGDRVIASCLEDNHGGTNKVLYIPFTYPTNESSTEITGTAYSPNLWGCEGIKAKVSVAFCPGGFFVYKPLDHGQPDMGYVTCE